MKKVLVFLFIFAVGFALTACESEQPNIGERNPTNVQQEGSTITSTTTANTVTLVANYPYGSRDLAPETVREYEFSYYGDLTIDTIAQELSALSGLDFFINSATIEGDVAYVDWSSSSTLLAGLDDREFYENFAFFDNVSLNWFMLESLNDSILRNLPVTEVIYTMNGGEELVVPNM